MSARSAFPTPTLNRRPCHVNSETKLWLMAAFHPFPPLATHCAEAHTRGWLTAGHSAEMIASTNWRCAVGIAGCASHLERAWRTFDRGHGSDAAAPVADAPDCACDSVARQRHAGGGSLVDVACRGKWIDFRGAGCGLFDLWCDSGFGSCCRRNGAGRPDGMSFRARR